VLVAIFLQLPGALPPDIHGSSDPGSRWGLHPQMASSTRHLTPSYVRQEGNVFIGVCLLVCRITHNHSTDFHKILWKGGGT